MVYPGKRGMAAWDCKSSSLIVPCALFSSPRCCPELTFHLEQSLEDRAVRGYTSTSIPFLFPALALCPCWWKLKCNLCFLLAIHMRLMGGVCVGESYLAATHTCTVKQFEWALLKIKSSIVLKKEHPSVKKIK